MSNRDYAKRIAQGLTNALERADTMTWNIDDTALVVFSDLHRGVGDDADDFRRCADTYHRALDFYYDQGYLLIVLGDSEELWENRSEGVLDTYGKSFDTEARFLRSGHDRYVKVWGNHDDLWKSQRSFSKYLSGIFGDMSSPECLDVTVVDGEETLGRIFLVHGHQGSPGSDTWGKYSRHFVRRIWRPFQLLFGISLTTPAESFEVRSKHDRAMYDWAANRNDLVLVAGHTHRPVFVSMPNIETIERIYSTDKGGGLESTSAGQEKLEHAAAQELAWAKAESGISELESHSKGRDRSCYFNTGCCSFSNGDITGLEISDGEIRLVRWATDLGDPSKRVLEARELRTVLAELNA